METPIACTLNKADLSQRRGELALLHQAIRAVHPTSDGFMLQFDGSTGSLTTVAEVIAKERLCCRFLRFQLTIEPDSGPLWLEVTGPNNSAKFLLDMFGFDQTDFESSVHSEQS